eukprot:TRINITY_DN2694_c0_g2_i1.p2 TRINITY_DN2694_c0_g2~~TRINITY_DN2694_c0_g2_i1.p2  ORF type:complete len:122 (-),score=31.95 TRINITY_DN2694_c0_g2_i1:106-471(-)
MLKKTFNSINGWKNEFLIQSGITTSKERERFPFILVGNKIDLSEERVVPKKKAMEWAEQEGVAFFETTAKEGTGVDKAFEMIAKMATKHHLSYYAKSEMDESMEPLEMSGGNSKSTCSNSC